MAQRFFSYKLKKKKRKKVFTPKTIAFNFRIFIKKVRILILLNALMVKMLNGKKVK